MSEIVTIPLTMDDDSQVVRLPEAFRLPGREVTVRRAERGVVIEPVARKMSREEIEAVFTRLRAYHDVPFMPEGREQPPMPEDNVDIDR